jgi:hypothetical protein
MLIFYLFMYKYLLIFSWKFLVFMFSLFMVLLLIQSPFNDEFVNQTINNNQNNLIQGYQNVFVFDLIVEHL